VSTLPVLAVTSSLSVVVCSHNPRRDYLKRVLEALASQDRVGVEWELILVDSASREPLARDVDLRWHSQARHVRESEPGLTRARLRGINEARGDILVFVDDDNVLDSDYLSQAARIAREWAHIGAWSGACRPEFERTPPRWTQRYWGNLVIREVPRDLWSNLPLLPETMPLGAGLCVRRAVASRYAELHATGARPDPLDRSAGSLMSGGDNDLAACACELGLGVGVFGSLRLTHLIPPERLEEAYLLKLIEGIAFSGVVLAAYWSPGDLRTVTLKRRIADSLRLLFMTPRERRFFRASRRGEQRALRHLSGSIDSRPIPA
jgi:hypothetical protein